MVTTIQPLRLRVADEGKDVVLSSFTCARFRFVLETTTPLRLNEFAGSTLRGGFGHVFKRLVCTWKPGACNRCLLGQACAYPYVFETAPPPGGEKLRGLDQIPRPYVFETSPGYLEQPRPRTFRPGERFDFQLILVGRAISYLPYFILTFQDLGRVGLGPGRGKFDLAFVYSLGQGTSQLVHYGPSGMFQRPQSSVTGGDLNHRFPPGVRWLRVQFLTPTRIRSDGIVQADLTFQDLVRALLRRLSSLCYFHCGRELEVDFKGLIEQAAAVRTIDSDLRWQDQERFSGRQQQRIDMGGVVGRVIFQAPDADTLAPYLPLLAAGELVHVGKGAVMGLGRYRVESG